MRTTVCHQSRAVRFLCLLLAALFLCAWASAPVQAELIRKPHKYVPSHQTYRKPQRISAHHRGKRQHLRPIVASNNDLRIHAKAAYLMNLSNGRVYYTQNPDDQIPPASLTKVLTLYLIREAIARGQVRPTTPIPVSSAAVLTGGSTMSLRRDERVPLAEMIKGISIVSANNACIAVAQYLGRGDTGRFVAQMNAKAQNLGMRRSRFKNPNGLPAPGQVTTARDMAALSAAYIRRFPEALAIHSMTTHTHNGVTHHNANALLGRCPGVDGLKTGFVAASGYNIIATAKRGNVRLVAVVLGANNPFSRETQTEKLLEYGFSRAAVEGAKHPPAAKKRHSARS